MGKNAQRKKQLRRAKEKEAMGLVVEEALPINSFSQEDLLTTARTLTQLAALDYETLHTKRFKEIRRAVFSFASTAGESFDGKGKKPQWVAKISDALRDQNWNHALELMSAARIGIIPKLGTLQRWVRDADLASSDKRNVIDSNTITSTNWVVLDAILRTSQQPIFKTGDNLKYSLSDGNTLRRFESWDPFDGKEFDSSYTTSPPDNLKYSIVTTEKRWKGVRDLSIFTTDNIIVSGDSPRGKKTPLPFIDGGFVMENIFSKEECNAIIGTAESMEFVPDAEYTMSTSDDSGPGKAAAGVVWLANDQMLNTIFNRVKHHLPQTLGGGKLAGINSRFRVYRYQSGAVYRPHIDGAWPGSGIVNGEYTFDAYGDRWSRLTFLVYLNEGMEGGTTTFFGPSDKEGMLDCRGVIPRTGNVLIFPHGDTAGALVHEGSEVSKGRKYVIRTDVLYIGKQEASLGIKDRVKATSEKLTGTKRSAEELNLDESCVKLKIAKLV